MPELLLEIAPSRYQGLDADSYWVDYITARDHAVAQAQDHELNVQQQFQQGQDLAWHMDAGKQRQVFGNQGASRNTSQVAQSSLTLNQRMGMDDARYVKAHKSNSAVRSGAHAVHVIGKFTKQLRQERQEAKHAQAKHKKYDSFAHMVRHDRAEQVAVRGFN